MSLLVKFLRNNPNKSFNINVITVNLHQANTKEHFEDEFKPLNLKNVKSQTAPRRKFKRVDVLPPREKQMPVDQDWGSVWPGPRTFHPATVPLPLHQGYVEKGAAPGKYGNAELMKIPNFLHITPPVIKRQCEALKKFCTPWPKGLENDQECQKHFPLEVITSSYCHSSPTIRDPLARIVSVKVKLSQLDLDAHARDKFLRIIGDRYDETTDTVTIVTDRCPTSKQNYDYALYLLTATYFESWKYESWEKEKTEADMEYYDWDTRVSCKNIQELNEFNKSCGSTEDLKTEEYRDVVNKIRNDGENKDTLSAYSIAVRKMLNVSLPL